MKTKGFLLYQSEVEGSWLGVTRQAGLARNLAVLAGKVVVALAVTAGLNTVLKVACPGEGCCRLYFVTSSPPALRRLQLQKM